jgi:hypothetical protein
MALSGAAFTYLTRPTEELGQGNDCIGERPFRSSESMWRSNGPEELAGDWSSPRPPRGPLSTDSRYYGRAAGNLALPRIVEWASGRPRDEFQGAAPCQSPCIGRQTTGKARLISAAEPLGPHSARTDRWRSHHEALDNGERHGESRKSGPNAPAAGAPGVHRQPRCGSERPR